MAVPPGPSATRAVSPGQKGLVFVRSHASIRPSRATKAGFWLGAPSGKVQNAPDLEAFPELDRHRGSPRSGRPKAFDDHVSSARAAFGPARQHQRGLSVRSGRHTTAKGGGKQDPGRAAGRRRRRRKHHGRWWKPAMLMIEKKDFDRQRFAWKPYRGLADACSPKGPGTVRRLVSRRLKERKAPQGKAGGGFQVRDASRAANRVQKLPKSASHSRPRKKNRRQPVRRTHPQPGQPDSSGFRW